MNHSYEVTTKKEERSPRGSRRDPTREHMGHIGKHRGGGSGRRIGKSRVVGEGGHKSSETGEERKKPWFATNILRGTAHKEKTQKKKIPEGKESRRGSRRKETKITSKEGEGITNLFRGASDVQA